MTVLAGLQNAYKCKGGWGWKESSLISIFSISNAKESIDSQTALLWYL